MLTYSIFMMLLLVTASLVGISSSIYKPANVETQPAQPQPLPGTKGLVTQKQFETTTQALADKQLLDRIMPLINKRLDGKTLLQKIDGKALAEKIDTMHLLLVIDGEMVVRKILPHIDAQCYPRGIDVPSQIIPCEIFLKTQSP
jgi:hypothetical protein